MFDDCDDDFNEGHQQPARILGEDPVSGRTVSVGVGKYGPMVQLGAMDDEEMPLWRGLREEQDVDTIRLDEALDMFKLPRLLGSLPGGEPVSANTGEFGAYLQYETLDRATGSSNPRFVPLVGYDPVTITFDEAAPIVRDHQLRVNRPVVEEDFARAQFHLATCYQTGRDLPQDYSEAARWYRRAADRGHVQAQLRLGWICATGRGLPVDSVQAHMWFNLAGAAGDRHAVYERESIAATMTSVQIAEAQRLAREWAPRSRSNEG